MSTSDRITSNQNERVKKIKRLKDRRDRDKTGLFLIEGFRELTRAVDAGVEIEELFFAPDLFLGENEPALISRIEKKTELTKQLFEKVSYRDRPDGLLAIAKKNPKGLQDCISFLQKTKKPFLLVAEAIEKPGNLGSIMRSADAAGVDAVIVCDKCTDITNPNVIRSSVGTVFALPVFELTSDETISLLQKQGIKSVATSPSAEKNYTEENLRDNIAIIVGTEQLGLSEKWLKAADISVKIPMMGIADSLNVSNATTLLLYEVLRQRV